MSGMPSARGIKRVIAQADTQGFPRVLQQAYINNKVPRDFELVVDLLDVEMASDSSRRLEEIMKDQRFGMKEQKRTKQLPLLFEFWNGM
eukprot:4001587-Amphidinium_carterae.1